VVQETAIAVARHLPEFRYDPEVCRFKTWLLNQSSWRIKDQLRRRHRNNRLMEGNDSASYPSNPPELEKDRTATIERIADPVALNLDPLFETEWKRNLFEAALENIKTKFSLKQIQIFDLHAQKEWPAGEVARSLGVSLANVYVTKHRVAVALRRKYNGSKRPFSSARHRSQHNQSGN
jgi:RNA polymerase sigma factor (sigma-70 family)